MTDQGSGHIYKYTPRGVRTTFAFGLSYPYALAFDSAGNLFVTEPSSSGDGYVDKFTPNGTRSTFATWTIGYDNPVSLAFNSAGNLFVGDVYYSTSSGRIVEFTPDGIQSASASYDSVQGTIKSSWSQTAAGITMNVSVPANTTVYMNFMPSSHLIR